MPTGLLRGCDLFVGYNPFAVALAPGTYPVVLTLMRLETPPSREFGDTRIGCASVVVSEDAPVRWGIAQYDRPDEGCPVDSWFACFMDEEARRLMAQRADEEDPEEYERHIRAEMQCLPNPHDSVPYVNHRPSTGSDANIIGFFSGLGSGLYSTWIGYDSRGCIARVVTDFEYLQIMAAAGAERPGDRK